MFELHFWSNRTDMFSVYTTMLALTEQRQNWNEKPKKILYHFAHSMRKFEILYSFFWMFPNFCLFAQWCRASATVRKMGKMFGFSPSNELLLFLCAVTCCAFVVPDLSTLWQKESFKSECFADTLPATNQFNLDVIRIHIMKLSFQRFGRNATRLHLTATSNFVVAKSRPSCHINNETTPAVLQRTKLERTVAAWAVWRGSARPHCKSLT